ncbi:MAG: AMP-binding protein [Actinobacteria bacterium]|jgi:acyl-CoA synthetase (AMP-forming)/AMP-acid ligase II|nr:AMP-binding protein [Actinomycetota bacterium]
MARRSVLDLLDDIASLGDAKLRFLPDKPDWRSPSELGRAAYRAGWWWRGIAEPGEAVAAVLTSSFDCLSVAYGAWLAGLRLVSLPHPARGVSAQEYVKNLKTMCALADARILVMDPAYRPLLPDTDLKVYGFDGYRRSIQPTYNLPAGPYPGSFVQFSSGSTSDPKGIVLSLGSLGKAIEATVDALEPREHEAGVSWLPLSHDMGFIGVCLAALGATAPPWNTRGTLTLIRPEAFLARPSIWLETCSEEKATFTAAPGFALELAARMLRHTRTALDLSSIRVISCGAEPIKANGLRHFADAARPFGFDDIAFCPAYGLAEATLGVTTIRPQERWRVERVDREALGEGVVELSQGTAADDTYELVSCGSPFANTDVRIAGAAAYGLIEVRSTSLMDGYLGKESVPIGDDGWLTTGDLGFMDGHDLFVTGRADDVIIMAGRNLYPDDIELVASNHPLVRKGDCAAVKYDGGYAIVVEPVRPGVSEDSLIQAGREIRAELARVLQASPTRVVFVTRNTLAKTPSGKLKRSLIACQLIDDELAVESMV